MKWPNIKSFFSKKDGNKKIEKTTANTGALKWIVVAIIIIPFFAVIFSPTRKTVTRNIYESDLKDKRQYSRHTSIRDLENNDRYVDWANEVKKNNGHEDPLIKESQFERKLNSDQVLINNDKGAFKIPPGSLFQAVLTNKIISNALNQPVIAMASAPFYQNSTLAIPQGSKLLGRATHDENLKRIHIKFNTVVCPDNTSKDFSGIALDLEDHGSAGLSGKYHSQKAKKVSGSLLSNFVSGLSEGFQDRSETLFGSSQKGSLKNGILGGISKSAQDQAKRFSNSLENTQGFIEIEPGYEFLIYIDREFSYQ